MPRFLADRLGPGYPTMIQNDQELKLRRERINYLFDLLARLRTSSRAEELKLVSSGYRTEVERMQQQVLDYLNSEQFNRPQELDKLALFANWGESFTLGSIAQDEPLTWIACNG